MKIVDGIRVFSLHELQRDLGSFLDGDTQATGISLEEMYASISAAIYERDTAQSELAAARKALLRISKMDPNRIGAAKQMSGTAKDVVDAARTHEARSYEAGLNEEGGE